jgi:hypothetical protein
LPSDITCSGGSFSNGSVTNTSSTRNSSTFASSADTTHGISVRFWSLFTTTQAEA